jgi:hypothetical protein
MPLGAGKVSCDFDAIALIYILSMPRPWPLSIVFINRTAITDPLTDNQLTVTDR